MFSQIFLRRSNLKNYSINQPLRRQFVSQTILSLKPTLSRILQRTCNIQLFGQSKIHTCSLRSSVCKHNGKISINRNSSSVAYVKRTPSVLDINTNVLNNVFLYKYDKDGFFAFLKGFVLFQTIVMAGLSYYIFTLLPKQDENLSLLTYAYDNFICVSLIITPIITGIAVLAFLSFFTARSVKYVILNKGGESATFVTYHILSGKATKTIPLDHISCASNRTNIGSYLSIKVKDHRFFYILDNNGEFVNPKLFDGTIGIKRIL